MFYENIRIWTFICVKVIESKFRQIRWLEMNIQIKFNFISTTIPGFKKRLFFWEMSLSFLVNNYVITWPHSKNVNADGIEKHFQCLIMVFNEISIITVGYQLERLKPMCFHKKIMFWLRNGIWKFMDFFEILIKISVRKRVVFLTQGSKLL